MIEGHSPFVQALLGTLFTWGLTAVGAGLVFVFSSGQRKILDGSLGFAAGVMTAASYWSLLAPAIEMAQNSGLYGEEGQWAFLPVAVGFTLGAVFVYAADIFMPQLGGGVASLATMDGEAKLQKDGDDTFQLFVQDDSAAVPNERPASTRNSVRQRGNPAEPAMAPGAAYGYDNNFVPSPKPALPQPQSAVSWKRIMLLIVAITIHNIPEGLAVGVGFGAIGKTKSATFENARNLAIGIGIQNFPEGLAVSLPLRGSGMSTLKSFWYGQLSGMVEPIAGMLGALAVTLAEPVLPYALAFAAGAMIYVVVDDIIPEAQTCGNGKLASWGAIVGFVVMMSLDVGLG